MKISGAKIVCECLLEQGVDTVFGFPGGSIINVYDELYKYQDKINHIITSHEQGAAHAADGYARTTGKVGVVIATSGPGATNLVTGIATAYMDSVPMVAITGNVALPLLGRDSFQEVDTTGITMPITKHNYIVKDVGKLADIIRDAFKIARSGRPGPVLIDLPKDIQIMKSDYVKIMQDTSVVYENESEESYKEYAQKLINSSKKPFIYAGGGSVISNATDELIELSEKILAPVATSFMGKSAFPADHKNHIGMIGMHGSIAAAKAVAECDLLIAIGARFSDRVAGDREKFAPNAKILHIDIDAAEINKNVISYFSIIGNIADVLRVINKNVDKKTDDKWLYNIISNNNEKSDGSKVTPKFVLKTLRKYMDKEDIISTDVGQHQMWTAQYFDTFKPRTFLSSGGLGTMGYGLGAAIGAKAGNMKKRSVLITGDGSFHMNLNELATAVNMDLPVMVIIMNNGVLGMVRQWQKLFFDKRFSNTTLNRRTDYIKVAEAFGAKGYRIEKKEDVEEVFNKAFLDKGTVVIDCIIDEDENVLPMVPPGKPVEEIITELD